MIIVIDNYDSFTYNLVQYVSEYCAAIEVYRNDCISIAGLAAKKPAGIIISPGPCTPLEAGVSVDVIKELGAQIPILGVCLGHQSIGYAYGGDVIRAPYLMHGKVSEIFHNGSDLYAGVPSPFTATRYHSLIVKAETLPPCLNVTAHTADGIIMGLRHVTHPVEGLQFHPESILTTYGKILIKNFVARVTHV